MLKLKEFVKEFPDVGSVLALTNVDDFFSRARKLKIKEFEVDEEEMEYIVTYVLASLPFEKEREIAYHTDKIDTLKLIKEYEIDKFMGINLHLNA